MSKTKIQYYLKSNGRTLREIVLRFSFGYKQVNSISRKVIYIPFQYNTGVKTTAEHWDASKNLPLKTTDLVEILKVQETLENLYKYLVDNKLEVIPELLKKEMDRILGRVEEVKTITKVTDFIYEFILEKEAKEEDDYEFKKSTRKNNKSLMNMILLYEERSKNIINAETLDDVLFMSFQKFCQDQTNKNNTAWTYMKNFIAVLRKISYRYKIKVFLPEKGNSQTKLIGSKNEDKIYLTFEEIQVIIDYAPQNQKMRDVKLMLLTLLFSGARYSDLHKVKPEKTYEKSSLTFKYAHFLTTKNPTEVVVPFVKPLEEAWLKSNRKSLPKMSLKEFNERVKVLCRFAGFTEIIKVVYTDSKGVKQFDEKAHFKFVSSHIGRRSFISNFINVVSPTLITKITGHTFSIRDVVFSYNKIKPMKGAILFMKFAKKLYDDEDWKDEFPIKLVA